MAEVPADQATLRRLRVQLAEYEQIFRTAAPRLAAFKKLEEVAREQGKTPAAVAAEASLVMLTKETRLKEEELRRLASECGELYAEAEELLSDLQLLRHDTVRLVSERRELEMQVEALRREIGTQPSRRADDIVVAPQASPEVGDPSSARTGIGFDLDDDDENRRFDNFFHADVEHDKARDWILG